MNADKLNIYPNPSNGIFTADTEIKPDESAFIEITDVLGQLIVQQRLVHGKEHTFSYPEKLSKGIYRLQLIKDGNVAAFRTLSIH
jgi:hypothetical protein